MAEAAAALVPLVATLGSFVAKGTGYALGAFVTALRAFVADKTTAGLGAFVGEHARARAVPLVPAGRRHPATLLSRAPFYFAPLRLLPLQRSLNYGFAGDIFGFVLLLPENKRNAVVRGLVLQYTSMLSRLAIFLRAILRVFRGLWFLVSGVLKGMKRLFGCCGFMARLKGEQIGDRFLVCYAGYSRC